MPGKSWIEIASDGDGETTIAYLRVQAEDGSFERYRLPHLSAVRWRVDGPNEKAEASLHFKEVHMVGSVEIRTGANTAEDLLATIAATRLSRAGEP